MGVILSADRWTRNCATTTKQLKQRRSNYHLDGKPQYSVPQQVSVCYYPQMKNSEPMMELNNASTKNDFKSHETTGCLTLWLPVEPYHTPLILVSPHYILVVLLNYLVVLQAISTIIMGPYQNIAIQAASFIELNMLYYKIIAKAKQYHVVRILRFW